MKREEHVKAAVKNLFQKYGAWYTMPMGQMFGKAGVPDFLACHKGRMIAVETKFGSNKPTALQKHELAGIQASGGVALVINEKNLGALEVILKEISCAGSPTD